MAATPAVLIEISPEITTGLKLVPSAIKAAPLVFVPIVRSSPLIVRSPASVALAPLKVKAVVVPDLIIKLPEVLVALPNVVPSSLKKTSPPPASKTISVPASTLKRAEAEIVKSVPSPSIFSPSLPKVTPTSAGILMSAPATRYKSVPSP